MTEYLFLAIEKTNSLPIEQGDTAVVIASTPNQALLKLQSHYKNCQFQLINFYCLDCE